MVSVIIPVYNVSEFIGECLGSVYGQTYGDIEVVVVDDCSPDDSMAVAAPWLEKLRERFSVTVVTHPENRGLSAARNSGIEASTGEWLYFLDSDDYIKDYAIELLTSRATDLTDLVIGGVEILGDARPFPTMDCRITRGREAVMDQYFARKISSTTWNVLTSARHYRDMGLRFPEGMNHEDELTTFRLLMGCDVVVSVLEPTYVYRIRTTGSIMATFNRKNLDDDIAVFCKKVKCLGKVSSDAVYDYFVGMVYLDAFRLSSGMVRGVCRGDYGDYFSQFKGLLFQVKDYGKKRSLRSRIICFVISLGYPWGYYFVKIHTMITKK